MIGTRPEAIKMAPVIRELRRRQVAHCVITTGQHRDWRMMGAFIAGFELHVDHELPPAPHDLLDSFLAIARGLGELFAVVRPKLVLAVGDTTTVIAAAFSARKSGSGFGHVEAGLRAFSRELPEEEHRICADAMADLLFAPTAIAVANLTREHVNGRIIHTGNTVLDALRLHAPTRSTARDGILVTLHRQETVDRPERLASLLSAINRLAATHSVIWPLHPRTRVKAQEADLELPRNVDLREPIDHAAFLQLLGAAAVVITDSGGVQEEAAILGTPCVIVRANTERMETIEAGVAVLASTDAASIAEATAHIFAEWSSFARPVPELYGDGNAGAKIVEASLEWLAHSSPVEMVA
ncbi:MAG TPA: UDP-N-acetylglucosamine 2-epimerase (non-hydrolyzing) [Kofleriaceae bacterium]|nr:UDP-N-acetylglucosamine 2-epimerase (non-hydrolyzing) [Kofleriaceae bacterium]